VRPLSELGVEEARGLRGLFFDLDDTLLSHGVLTRAAYDALWDLADAGLAVVAITGRPSGWAELIARQWPVNGCIAENGAVSFVREGPTGKSAVVLRDTCDPAQRASRRERLARLVATVRELVPEARLADDASARRSDVTWDVGERMTLPDVSIRRIVDAIEAAGARHTQSSVHLHATFDVDDKASGAVRFCVDDLGQDASAALARYAFVGDSGNDAACFAAFRTTFGVANVRAHLSRLSRTPKYVASAAMGDGFAEIARTLLTKRK
jgi:HAD superfamily hydrolase (TIGR01484 family)